MGGSNSREEKSVSESVIVSGQANVTFSDHDLAQWWTIGGIIFIFVVFVLIFGIRRFFRSIRDFRQQQNELRAAVLELRANRTN